MRRLILLPALVGMLVVSAAACGGEEGDALDTLPPIRTTTTVEATTTTIDDRRMFYEVKPGDHLAKIASSFDVPAIEIVRINNLTDGGQVLQIGQLLEIPTDMVLVEELPDPSETTLGP